MKKNAAYKFIMQLLLGYARFALMFENNSNDWELMQEVFDVFCTN